jgi:hypothetical protein
MLFSCVPSQTLPIFALWPLYKTWVLNDVEKVQYVNIEKVLPFLGKSVSGETIRR